MGKMWLEHVGKMNIIEQNTGSKCVIEFKPHSFFHKYTRAVREAKRFVILSFSSMKCSMIQAKNSSQMHVQMTCYK